MFYIASKSWASIEHLYNYIHLNTTYVRAPQCTRTGARNDMTTAWQLLLAMSYVVSSLRYV